MNIKFISHKPYTEIEVYDENEMAIHIKIDIEIQAFRIKCLDTRRVFSIANEGTKKNKTTALLNEYSQQLGTLTRGKSAVNTGEIEIEGVEYTFRLNDSLKEINLFEYNSYDPVLSCKLEMGQLSFLSENYISYLLFSLVWFKFLTKEQATFAQFAER